MNLTVDRASDVPLYRQVVDQIRDLIQRGVLSAGTRLPTVRALADSAGLTRLTVQNAYQELQAQGLIESFVGRGTFVAERPASRLPFPGTPPAQPPISWNEQGMFVEMLRFNEATDLISFAHASPAPETYPLREFSRALRAALEDPTALGYSSAQGEAVLREQFSRLLLDRGVAVPPEQILITNGAQQGIDLAFRALAGPGDVVLVEEPTYPGTLEVAARIGQRVVGIPLDDDGPSLAHLEGACVAYRPRLYYGVPTYHNPTGICYSPERRARLLALAEEHDFLIIDDDVYGLLPLDGPAPLALKADDRSGRVVYLTSFSKAFMPGVRLGAMAAASPQLAALVRTKQHTDLTSSPLMQRACAHYLQRGHLGTHLQAVRDHYRLRRDAMLFALARHVPECAWTHPKGGLCLWLTLPPGLAEAEIYESAIGAGISLVRGQAFYPQPQSSGRLRLSYGAETPERIEQGIAALGRVIAAHLRRRDALHARAYREAAPLV